MTDDSKAAEAVGDAVVDELWSQGIMPCNPDDPKAQSRLIGMAAIAAYKAHLEREGMVVTRLLGQPRLTARGIEFDSIKQG